MLQNRRVKFLLKPLGNLDFLDPIVNSSLPFRLHAAYLSITVVIIEEEITSTCSYRLRAWEGFTSPDTEQLLLPVLVCGATTTENIIRSTWQTRRFPDEPRANSFEVSLVGC